MPAIAMEGFDPPTGDATCKGVGEEARSAWRLGVFHFRRSDFWNDFCRLNMPLR